jgi:hypothetical protein
MLMTPERFDWTIHFLNSSLWEIIKEQIQNEISITLSFLISALSSRPLLASCWKKGNL